MRNVEIVIVGAGPAGLTAAYLLAKKGVTVCVLEADPRYVGGISRTVNYKGFLFDIGGHRFFSKSQQVEDFWTEILPNDLLVRQRSSQIYYRGKFFSYPLKALEALLKLGIWESILCVASYLRAKLFPILPPKSFEDWTANQFGRRLFTIFFKTYTEKVWGMNCKDISADWAAQRIKGLSLGTAIWNALFSGRGRLAKSKVIKSLIESFRYPRLGPGMLWEECATKTKQMGGEIYLGSRAVGFSYNSTTQKWTVTFQSQSKTNRPGNLQNLEMIECSHVISTCPIRELAKAIHPKVSTATLKASQSLKYRDFLTVMVILKDRNLFTDNWIYIHDPLVKVGRIQNFKSWSPEMVPDPSLCCYGLEYFCFEQDSLWASSDEDLLTLAKNELEKIGLAHAADVIDGCVVRQPKAYPVYDDLYAHHVSVVRQELEEHYPNLHLIGRNGMHKYNNQDHAMMTAMLTVENILSKKLIYDVWRVNEDAEYHESGTIPLHSGTNGLRAVPVTRKAG